MVETLMAPPQEELFEALERSCKAATNKTNLNEYVSQITINLTLELGGTLDDVRKRWADVGITREEADTCINRWMYSDAT